MIEPTQAAAAATTGGAVARTTAVKPAPASKDFAGVLAKASATTDATTATKAAARPDGEQTKKVAGHPYARIDNGSDKGLYLNQVADSPREGAAFRLVERGDRVFHVYGTGKDKVIIGLKAPAATDSKTTAT